MKKKIILALACLLPLTIMAQDLKFGYFNRAEILQSMPETQAANKKIDELAKTYDKELKTIQDDYQKKGSDFVASRDSLPEAIKTRRMAEIQELEERLQTYYQEAQKEIQKAQQDLYTPISTKLSTAVKAIGSEQGFIYIFDVSVSSGLMYWSTDKCVDVTNSIRTKLNLK
jgi:outer membrane protein